MVEDNEINQIVLLKQLEILGYPAVVAKNGLQGLEMWQDKIYDVILLDCHMPVMDGFEFLTHFNAKKMENPPKIIIFSGMELDDTLKATLESVHVGFVDKNDSNIAEKLRDLTSSSGA